MRVGILIPLREDVDGCIQPMAELGFCSCQISVWDMSLYNDDIAARLRESLKKHRMTLTALWCGWSGPVNWKYPDMYDTLGLVPAYLRGQRIADLLRGAAFARSLGVRDVVTHVGFLPDNPHDQNLAQIIQALRYICQQLKEHDQRFLFETGEELPVTLLRVIEMVGTGNLGVNFDPANLLMNGRANPADALRLLSPYLMGMHGKDGKYPEHGQPKGREYRLGEGEANYPVLVRQLKRIGFEGDITIERETPEGLERTQDLIHAKHYLEQLIEED